MTRARDLANLIGSGNFTTETLTATAGQTAFTPSNTFTSNFLQVFYNGLLLDPTVDFTENGTTITLTVPATAGDEMEVVTYNTFSVGDAITQTEADVRYVNAAGDTMSGPLEIKQSQGSAYGGWATALNLNSYYPSYDETAVRATIDSGIPDTGVLNTTYGWIGLATRGGDGLNRRLIVNSSGHVTMPYQPAVKVSGAGGWIYSAAGGTGGWSGGNYFSYVDTDRGNNYNTSNFRWTVPVSGMYWLYIQAYHNSTGYARVQFWVNGSHAGIMPYGLTHGRNIGGDSITSSGMAVYLNAGDWVLPNVYVDNGGVYYGGGHTYFSGYLIG